MDCGSTVTWINPGNITQRKKQVSEDCIPFDALFITIRKKAN